MNERAIERRSAASYFFSSLAHPSKSRTVELIKIVKLEDSQNPKLYARLKYNNVELIGYHLWMRRILKKGMIFTNNTKKEWLLVHQHLLEKWEKLFQR